MRLCLANNDNALETLLKNSIYKVKNRKRRFSYMHTEPFPPLIRNDCLIEASSEIFILAEWRCSGQPGRPSPPTPSATAAVQPDLVQLCLWCAAACRPAAAWADPQARRRRIEANSAPLAMNLLPMVQKFSTVFARIAERVTQKAKKRKNKVHFLQLLLSPIQVD